MPVYVQLFHGRNEPDQDMDDWGEQGPVFKVDWFHVTYANHIRMGNAKDDDMELKLVGDMLFYDSKYYGDWSVFSDSSVDLKTFEQRMTEYDHAKAVPPVKPVKVVEPTRMSEKVNFTLSRLDIGQALDGLRARVEAWRITQRYHEQGEYLEDSGTQVEECSDADEARQIADHFEAIIKQLEAQL